MFATYRELVYNMNLIIQSDYLPHDSEILKRLDNSNLWIELSNKSAKDIYQWWDGKTQPNNIWEELIYTIWGNIDFNSIAGFEYWANICTEGDTLDWHQDKDEPLFREQKKTVSPKSKSK